MFRSTAARVPPTTNYNQNHSIPAAPSLSARAYTCLNSSLLPTPRPPTTTRVAVKRSGLYYQDRSSPTDQTLTQSPI